MEPKVARPTVTAPNPSDSRSIGSLLSLLALLPLALAFFAPGVARFVVDANDRTAVAVAMWAALFGFVILGFQALPGSKPDRLTRVGDILLMVALASVLAGTALYLASLRGA